jgi:outer membrane receptor for ferrienterochelin and colicin
MSLLKKWKASALASVFTLGTLVVGVNAFAEEVLTADDASSVSAPAVGDVPAANSVPQQKSDPEPMGEDAVVKAQTITVISRRMDNARNALSPDAGTSQYQFSDADIANLPQGDATPLNQVLLQAPGIVQDGFGQVHVRGDHGNLQYRVNGVMIPEAISGFGQVIDTRFADQINVITGALPAQYGFRTAGVVDIHTRGPGAEPGGEFSVSGGSRNYGETGAVLNGSVGAFSYNLAGSWLTSELGIENPTPALNALHDRSEQGKGFAFLAYDLNPQQRISLTFGHSENAFQIPDNPALAPTYSSTLTTTPAPQSLNANQTERNQFEVASFQSHDNALVEYQVALYHRLTDVHYTPDPHLGDLLYTGVSNDITRRNEAEGVQTDVGVHWMDNHVLRTGFTVQRERYLTNNASLVYCAAASLASGCTGNQLTNGVANSAPTSIADNSAGVGHFWGVSLQDEWKLVPHLTVNYGLRFDQSNVLTDEHQISPRLALVWEATERTRVHAGFAEYFTPPPAELINSNTVAAFANTTNASPSNADTSVKAERSDYFDFGVSRQVSDHLTLDVDTYYRQVRHLQDEGQFGNALIFSSFNYEQGRVYGLEMTGTYHDGRWTESLNMAVGRAQGKNIETGQFNFSAAELSYISNHWIYLDHDQRYTLSGSMTYHADWANFSADGVFGSGLRSGFANMNTLPAYATLNLATMRTVRSDSFGTLEGRLTLINVFDRSYELRDGTGIGVGAPQYGQRRTIMVGLSRLF